MIEIYVGKFSIWHGPAFDFLLDSFGYDLTTKTPIYGVGKVLQVVKVFFFSARYLQLETGSVVVNAVAEGYPAFF